MRRTPLATPPGGRDPASVAVGRLRGGPRGDHRLPFDTGVSSAVVSPGTNGSAVRVSRRVASAALSGTDHPTVDGDPPSRGDLILGPWARWLGTCDPPSRPPPPPRQGRGAASRYASAATISRALSISLQSSFRRSLAVRLVLYRNRVVISLGRTSPAAFGLRYKAGLLACGRRFRAVPRSPRGSNSLRLLATFQIVLRARDLRLARPRHNSPGRSDPPIRRRTRSFSFATTRELPVGFSYSR